MKRIISTAFLFMMFFNAQLFSQEFAQKGNTTLNFYNGNIKPDKKMNTLSIYSGYLVSDGYRSSGLLILAASFERFFRPQSHFSWSIDLDFWYANSLMIYNNYSLNYHLLRESSFDPYLGVGLLSGYIDGVQVIDFPATLGANFWFSDSFGLKAQTRIFLVSGFDLMEINFGLIFTL